MFEQLQCAVAQMRRLVGELEPDRFDGPGARRLVELFDEVERLGAAGKALATRQVVATGAWKHDGAHRDAAVLARRRHRGHRRRGSCHARHRRPPRRAARHRGRVARRRALRRPGRRHRRCRVCRSRRRSRALGTRRARRCARPAQRVRAGEGRGLRRSSGAVRAHPRRRGRSARGPIPTVPVASTSAAPSTPPPR